MARNRIARGTQRTPNADLPAELGFEDAPSVVQRYQLDIDRLTSLHLDCSEPRDWDRIANEPVPARPAYTDTAERAASDELDGYRPRLLDRLNGKATARRAQLAALVRQAITADRAQNEAALSRHHVVYKEWSLKTTFAARVLRLDEAACREAMPVIADFAALDIRIELASVVHRVATVSCAIPEPIRVPREEITLSALGDVSRSPMPAEKYAQLYQAYLCSCAIRAARETFAALPTLDVVVEVSTEYRDPITGAVRSQAALTGYFAYEVMASLDALEGCPSEALAHFPHKKLFSILDRPTPLPIAPGLVARELPRPS